METPFTAEPTAEKLPPLLSGIVSGFAIVAGVLLCLLTLLICIDATGRTLVRIFEVTRWGYTLPWTLEVAEYTLYFITFLGAPWVLKTQNHITVDILVEALPWRVNRYLRPITDLIGFFLLIPVTRKIFISFISSKFKKKKFDEGFIEGDIVEVKKDKDDQSN